MPTQQAEDEREATDRLMLDLFIANFEPMGARGERITSRTGLGLVGHVYGGTDDGREIFRRRLADLMLEYGIDKVDCMWNSPDIFYALRARQAKMQNPLTALRATPRCT